jgi:hypothetical protein
VSPRPVSEVVEILQKLVTATPAPVGGCDPSDLVDQAEKIAAEREPLCAALGKAVESEGAGVKGAAPLVAALADVDARWQAALAAARVALGQRTTGAAARRYRGG